MTMQHNLALQAFRVVAEQKNFTKAAAKLNISPSALSQTIRQLENKLNLRLFHRTTRSVSLTEAGQNLFVRIVPLLDEIGHIFDELKQEDHLLAGSLRLTMPYIVWQTIICPLLPEFNSRYPHIELDIHISDGLIDIIREGYDAGIRMNDVMHQDMVAFPINRGLDSIIVGSKNYFSYNPIPSHPDDLQNHRCLNYRFQTGGTIFPWSFQKDDQNIKIIPKGMVLTEEVALIQAVKAGLGIANLFAAGIRDELMTNEFIPVLTDWTLAKTPFYFYYPSRHYVSSRLRVFIELLKTHHADI